MRAFVSALLCSAAILASFSPISRADDFPEEAVTQADDAVPVLSGPASEVVRMLDAHVADEVITAYIDGSNQRFNLTAEQIVYLKDLGVSSEIVTAMLRRDVALGSSTETSADAQTNAPSEVASLTESESPVREVTPPLNYVGEPPQEVAYFYDSLSPYGTWIYADDLGWSWQPNVAVLNRDWAPYCNDGNWLWTDDGWYWASDYSWGWAPFHYGRWQLTSHWGWLWCPDTVWAPSWVTWRVHDSYCGWAPLPPGAYFDFGLGLRFRHGLVSSSFDFGLSPSCFTFVGFHDFFGHDLRHRRVPRTQVNQIFNNTVVINNFSSGGRHNVVVNKGVGVNRVSAATGQRISPVPVVEASALGQTVNRAPRQVVRNGETRAVVRTPLPEARRSERMLAQRVRPQERIIPQAATQLTETRLKAPRTGETLPLTTRTRERSKNELQSPRMRTENSIPRINGPTRAAQPPALGHRPERIQERSWNRDKNERARQPAVPRASITVPQKPMEQVRPILTPPRSIERSVQRSDKIFSEPAGAARKHIEPRVSRPEPAPRHMVPRATPVVPSPRARPPEIQQAPLIPPGGVYAPPVQRHEVFGGAGQSSVGRPVITPPARINAPPAHPEHPMHSSPSRGGGSSRGPEMREHRGKR
jgi:hypothetical protein